LGEQGRSNWELDGAESGKGTRGNRKVIKTLLLMFYVLGGGGIRISSSESPAARGRGGDGLIRENWKGFLLWGGVGGN